MKTDNLNKCDGLKADNAALRDALEKVYIVAVLLIIANVILWAALLIGI